MDVNFNSDNSSQYPRGYWVRGYPITCSVCGNEAKTLEDTSSIYSVELTTVCPHCNSIMDLERES